MPKYVVFLDDKDKPNVRGPYYTTDKAEKVKESLVLEGFNPTIHDVRTTNLSAAVRVLKERRIEEFGFRAGSARFRRKHEEAL